MAAKTPVYFLSHGGPNIMEQKDHPAYAKLQEIGREITTRVKPKAVVVFSAHWQEQVIEVNTAESMGLIYDFYGFPAHYYEFQYPNKGSPQLAERVLTLLGDAGIKAEGVRRGLDHGVWASFMCAFDPKTNPLEVPIVQVSLSDREDPDGRIHQKLGRAVAGLREEGVQIIVSGMAVHNLRDMHRTWGRPGALDYTMSFDEALKEAVEQEPGSREEAMAQLLGRKDTKKAHPSIEHLLPIYVGAGAASEEKGERLWTLPEGSMSWAQYRFGAAPVS